MDLIPCSKQNTSKKRFICFCDEKVKLISDQYLVEEANEKKFKLIQILSIQKILLQPACILTQLDWRNELQISQDIFLQQKGLYFVADQLTRITLLQICSIILKNTLTNYKNQFLIYQKFGLRLIKDDFIRTLRIQRYQKLAYHSLFIHDSKISQKELHELLIPQFLIQLLKDQLFASSFSNFVENYFIQFLNSYIMQIITLVLCLRQQIYIIKILELLILLNNQKLSLIKKLKIIDPSVGEISQELNKIQINMKIKIYVSSSKQRLKNLKLYQMRNRHKTIFCLINILKYQDYFKISEQLIKLQYFQRDTKTRELKLARSNVSKNQINLLSSDNISFDKKSEDDYIINLWDAQNKRQNCNSNPIKLYGRSHFFSTLSTYLSI